MWNSQSSDMKQIYKIKKKIKKIFESSKVKYHPHKYRVSAELSIPSEGDKTSDFQRHSDTPVEYSTKRRSSDTTDNHFRKSDSHQVQKTNKYRANANKIVLNKKNQPLFSLSEKEYTRSDLMEKDYKRNELVRNNRNDYLHPSKRSLNHTHKKTDPLFLYGLPFPVDFPIF